MKHTFSLFSLCLLFLFPVHSQSVAALQDLEGVWYQAGRTAVCYSIWYYTNDQTLNNRTFSILCGDTIELSTATVTPLDGNAMMTLYADSIGKPQLFKLAQHDDDAVVWENVGTAEHPRQIEWFFSGNNYCTFRADGVETDFRHKRSQPLKLRFQMLAGINQSHFPIEHYGHKLGFSGDDEFQQLSGQDLALAVGLVFPETPLTLHLELGITRRRVGVLSTAVYESVIYRRDGVYEYLNTYLALMPELSFGRKRSLSLSGGFYFGLAQIRDFRGTNSATGTGAPDPAQTNIRLDVSKEHGLLAGVSYCLPILPQLRPTVFVRYTRGLIDSKVRATSIGMAFQIGKR